MFQLLLAIGIDALVRGVRDSDDQLVVMLDPAGNIEGERFIASLMMAAGKTVQPDVAYLVDRFKVQERSLGTRMICKVPAVPEYLPGLQFIRCAGQV